MKKQRERKWALSTTQIIVLGFLTAIIIGGLLLSLPVSSADGQSVPLIDAMFTSTTSVCVTGLVVTNTYEQWSRFGQAVILMLIQCGGLGIVTFTTSFMLILGRKVTLRDRLLMQDAYNLNTLTGLVKFTKKVIFGTLIVESIGAVLYMFTFIPEFGWKEGIWISVFNSVSAFCNAGIDIIGPNSLAPYVTNVSVNLITMALIILGGIGFIVWWDILHMAGKVKKKEVPSRAFFNRLSLHTKIVLTTTLCLIGIGTLLIFILEYNNPETIGGLAFGDKIMASAFESVTARTAGFLTFSQKAMRDSSALVCMILMFIGGSPVGTAGGVKTSTFALVIIAAMSAVKGSEHGTAFRRRLHNRTMRKALAVILISFLVAMSATIMLSTFCGGALTDVMFETFSAIGTSGLTRDYTAAMNSAGKIIIMICMYLGRVGPISMAIIFGFKKNKYGLAEYPSADITVG